MVSKAEFCSFCLALISTAWAQTTEIPLNFCQPELIGWKFENSATERCYEFVSAKADRAAWSDAQDYCQRNGGRLINIESRDKQEVLELLMNKPGNKYKPDPKTYDPVNNKTWGDYDPDVWIGAMRDSDGTTWRFDQYTTSRTVRSVILSWFNYGKDPVLIREANLEKNKFATDTCLFMRFNWVNGTGGASRRIAYPWYQHQRCSAINGHKHPYICEYEGYAYRKKDPTSNWFIVIAVLGAFVSCGFLSCTIYCLWDKIHTSYNVLQV